MIFHNIYSITIGEFAEMMETGNINIVKRFKIWIPKKIVEKGYIKLIKSFNEQSNKDGSNRKEKQDINDGFDKLGISYQSLWYESIFMMINVWLQLDGENKKNVWSDICKLYKTKYGKEPIEKDLGRITREHTLLIEKASQVFGKPEENKKVDFESDVMWLEKTLAPVTIRDKKLYTYNKYIKKLALKKS